VWPPRFDCMRVLSSLHGVDVEEEADNIKIHVVVDIE
jgi:hypothetical protein